MAARYRILRTLGEGAMGRVYEAEHVHVGRRVALKVLHPEVTHRDIARRFRDEAKAASAAGHPNIIDVLDAGELEDGRPFIAMEFLDGTDVFAAVTREGKLEPVRAMRIAAEVGRALQAAHDKGIVHRDLKGENVMLVQRDGVEHVKVVDFGIAHGGERIGPRRTAEGLVMGTPEYMSPEQAEGRPAAPAFDIYALGVLLYEMLSGHPPFRSESAMQILAHKALHPAPRLAEAVPSLPAPLCALVDRCLARAAADRPATAAEVADELERLVAGAEDSASRDDWARRSLDEAPSVPAFAGERGSWRWMVVACVAAGLITGAFVLLRPAQKPGIARTATPRPQLDRASAAEEPPAAEPVPEPVPEPAAEPVPEPAAEPAAEPPVVEDTPAPPPPREGRSESRRSTAKARPATPEPAVTPDEPEDTAACEGVVDRALQYRRGHFFAKMLDEVEKISCWDDSVQRRRLLVLGLLETGRYGECVREAEGLRDAEVQRWAETCRRRQEESR